MSYFTPEQVRAAIAHHGTVFFDHALNPVVPEPDQCFCEFHIHEAAEGNEFVRDEAFVFYAGKHERVTYIDGKPVSVMRDLVATEYDEDELREPSGDILVRQA